MNHCADCAAETQQKIAAKADDQDAEKKAKQYAIEHGEPVALYRNEYGALCFVPARDSSGYPVVGYLSHLDI